jgi:serine/threonine protein kinase
MAGTAEAPAGGAVVSAMGRDYLGHRAAKRNKPDPVNRRLTTHGAGRCRQGRELLLFPAVALTDSLVRENETVAGKYLIGRTLGEGGMGVVVAARHLELDQMVAIKFLRPEIAEEGASAERFRREARAAVKIRSEHVCRVLDVGTLENGVPYLVMEYLEGCDLSDELARRGKIPVEEAVNYILQACEALAEAHAAGIVHRDLKPGNLFLEVRRDGTRGIKVLDFGVSKSIIDGPGQLRLTKTASLVGSPLYMSPEQLDAAKDVDARADIWALSTILFELIAGRTPFYAETIPQLVHAVMSGTPPPFSELGVAAPSDLEKAIFTSLSKRRSERHQTIADFARALAPSGPPHAIVSVLRTERVLASTGGGSTKVPLGAASASGPWRTPKPVDNGTDAITTRTMDVSAPPAATLGATPTPWGATKNDERGKLRRGVVMALTIASAGGVGLVILFALFRGRSSDTVRPEPSQGVAAAAAPSLVAAPTLPAEAPSATAAPPPAPFTSSTAEARVAPAPTVGPSGAGSMQTTKGAVTPPGEGGAARRLHGAGTGVPRASGSGVSTGKVPPPSEGISDFGGRR